MINLILTLLGLCGLLGALLWLALERVKRLQNKLTDAERTIAAQKPRAGSGTRTCRN